MIKKLDTVNLFRILLQFTLVLIVIYTIVIAGFSNGIKIPILSPRGRQTSVYETILWYKEAKYPEKCNNTYPMIFFKFLIMKFNIYSLLPAEYIK